MTSHHVPDKQAPATLQELSPISWTELIDPLDADVSRVASMAGFDEKFIYDALDLHERPRIEVDDETTLLVIRAPHALIVDGAMRYSTIPIGVLLSQSTLVVVCKLKDGPLVDILRKSKFKTQRPRAESAICSIVKDIALLFMHYLKDISAKIQEVERELADSPSNDDLTLLLNLQKSVTYFHAALKTNDFIIDRIIRKGLSVGCSTKLAFTEDEIDTLDDALTDFRQGIYMSKIFNEVLDSISNVYSSIISNNLNQVMKILTSFTVILMIPTLITSTYGMNIPLPFQGQERAFLLVAVATVCLTVAVVLLLKKKKIL